MKRIFDMKLPLTVFASLFLAVSCLSLNLRILFLGNSHTANFNIPFLVKSLLESNGTGTTVTTKMITGAFLDDLYERPDVLKEIATRYDFVVLQATKLSSSHQFNYSQKPIQTLAAKAYDAGSRVFLFAEWSRRGMDETDYILGVYRQTEKLGQSTIVPVCRAFDRALLKSPNLELWASDGNHSSLQGAYLAALTIYHWIAPKNPYPTFKPSGIAAPVVESLRAAALHTAISYR